MEKGKKLKQSEVNGVSRSVQFLDQVHLGEVILIQSNSETVIKLATLPGLLPEAYMFQTREECDMYFKLKQNPK